MAHDREVERLCMNFTINWLKYGEVMQIQNPFHLVNSDESWNSSDNGDEQASNTTKSERKRKGENSVVPKLIDNKRKHLERNLSSPQRNQLLLKESMEDSKFCKELADSMRESTKSFLVPWKKLVSR